MLKYFTKNFLRLERIPEGNSPDIRTNRPPSPQPAPRSPPAAPHRHHHRPLSDRESPCGDVEKWHHNITLTARRYPLWRADGPSAFLQRRSRSLMTPRYLRPIQPVFLQGNAEKCVTDGKWCVLSRKSQIWAIVRFVPAEVLIELEKRLATFSSSF